MVSHNQDFLDTEAFRQEASARQRARWQDPEFRARMVAQLRARGANPAWRGKMARAMAIHAAKHWTPERRAAASQRSREWYAASKHACQPLPPTLAAAVQCAQALRQVAEVFA